MGHLIPQVDIKDRGACRVADDDRVENRVIRAELPIIVPVDREISRLPDREGGGRRGRRPQIKPRFTSGSNRRLLSPRGGKLIVNKGRARHITDIENHPRLVAIRVKDRGGLKAIQAQQAIILKAKGVRQTPAVVAVIVHTDVDGTGCAVGKNGRYPDRATIFVGIYIA